MKHYVAKQPPALFFLSFSELWERFGFYTVQSILVLYLTIVLKLTDVQTNDLYSSFSTLLYAAPVVGGFLADRYLGFRHAIILGNIIYIIGYSLMLAHSQQAFYLAMALLICGNGFFKSNISSLLGTLYKHGDDRRDSGFTLFYLGINLGGGLGAVVSAMVIQRYGYHYALACSSIGMLISLVNFICARRFFKGQGKAPLFDEKHHIKPKKLHYYWIYFGILVVALFLSFIIQYARLVELGLLIFCIIIVLYSFYYTAQFKSIRVRNHMIGLFILYAFSVIFWSSYMLVFSSVTLFISRNVELHFLGINLPPSIQITFTTLFIVLFSPFVAKLWLILNERSINLNFAAKFAIGNFFQGLSFLVLVIGIFFHNSDYKIAYWWLVLAAAIRVIGELSLSPIGLSAVTELAPSKLVGMMMGIWFLTLAGGIALGNFFANWAAVPQGITDPKVTLSIYQHAFLEYSIISIIAAVILLCLVPFFKKMVIGLHDPIENKEA